MLVKLPSPFFLSQYWGWGGSWSALLLLGGFAFLTLSHPQQPSPFVFSPPLTASLLEVPGSLW